MKKTKTSSHRVVPFGNTTLMLDYLALSLSLFLSLSYLVVSSYLIIYHINTFILSFSFLLSVLGAGCCCDGGDGDAHDHGWR